MLGIGVFILSLLTNFPPTSTEFFLLLNFHPEKRGKIEEITAIKARNFFPEHWIIFRLKSIFFSGQSSAFSCLTSKNYSDLSICYTGGHLHILISSPHLSLPLPNCLHFLFARNKCHLNIFFMLSTMPSREESDNFFCI